MTFCYSKGCSGSKWKQPSFLIARCLSLCNHISIVLTKPCRGSFPQSQLGHVVWRKEKESTGTSVKGGCCHWMTLASPGMKVALQPVRGAMHRRSVNPNHHNSSKSKTCRMQGSTKVRSAKTAYKGYPDVNNVKCIKRSNSTIYHHLHNIRFQHPSASFSIFRHLSGKHPQSDVLPSAVLADSASWAQAGPSAWC